MLEEKVVGGLLLMVLGARSTAGSSSPACPTSSPAEIMEQRLSNHHPGLTVPAAAEPSPSAGCLEGCWSWEGGLGHVDWCRWLVPLPPPGEREWK